MIVFNLFIWFMLQWCGNEMIYYAIQSQNLKPICLRFKVHFRIPLLGYIVVFRCQYMKENTSQDHIKAWSYQIQILLTINDKDCTYYWLSNVSFPLLFPKKLLLLFSFHFFFKCHHHIIIFIFYSRRENGLNNQCLLILKGKNALQ